jgi:hypothetical protein
MKERKAPQVMHTVRTPIRQEAKAENRIQRTNARDSNICENILWQLFELMEENKMI